MSLVKYTVRRILALIPILFGVLFMTFIMTRIMPGNPFMLIVGEHVTDSQLATIAALEARYGLNEPILVQLWMYVQRLFSGDWGESLTLSKGTPVWTMILEVFPKTAELAIISVGIATIVGIKAGISSAVNRNKRKDTFIRFFALMGVAIPVFWLGMILQYIFGYTLDILPTTNYWDVNMDDIPKITHFRLIDTLLAGNFAAWWDTVLHLIMPVFCLSYIYLAGITRQTRSSMLEVLELDYIRTARAKGCKEKDVINTHAKKNAMIPTVTIIGLGFGSLLTGAVLTETTFGLAGIGQLLIDAIANSDYWVLNGLVFFFALVFISINLFTDVIYGILDPRIRY